MEHELLRLTERIAIAPELGESHFREFKSGVDGPPNHKVPRAVKEVCADVGRTLVAFANADGGELIVGVEDDGTVTGMPFDDEKLAIILGATLTHVFKDTPLPGARASKVKHGDMLLLYFSVPKGAKYVYLTSEGKCVQRKDRESVPITFEAITFSRAEVVSREYDRSFVEGATVADLDVQLLTSVASKVSKGMSPEKCLQHLELADFDGAKLRLRRAALLLFAKKPSKWHPRLQVRVLRIKGNEIGTGEGYNVVADEESLENVLTLLESSWDLVRPHLTETRFAKDALFRAQIMYPELACREALVNAIAHRDYSLEGRGIEVRVFSNRLEIVSPGALLSSIRIDDLRTLKGVHQSRNSLIAKVLREVGYMRELGEGMRRIYELMRSNDLTPPELISDGNVFSVMLHHRLVYTKEQKLWLDGFDTFTLTREQKTVVLLGYNGHVVSPKEIWEAVGIVDTEDYRKLISSLAKIGILTSTMNKTDASNLARKKRIPTKHVPRFSIIPLKSGAGAGVEDDQMPDDSDYAKIYVANLPYLVNEQELGDLFQKNVGDVADVIMPKNVETGKSRGFAFVVFERKQDADAAVQLSGKLLIGVQKLFISLPRRETQAFD